MPQLVEKGRVIRGWLGIGADDLPMFPALNQRIMRGAVITGVLPNGPAGLAGLKPYDVVTRVGDQAINNTNELLLLISALNPADSVEMEIWRRGELITVTPTLIERPRSNK